MRNKLIELIQDATDEFAEEGWKHFECVGTPPFSCVPTICRSEFIADHLIANGVTIQRWIPVEERLPEDSGDVLVCHKNGFVTTNAWLGHNWWFKNEKNPITHWMSLPKLHKEVGMYNSHEVACILAEVTGDDCACNVNGNDEWLPLFCELQEACPHPEGVACWEQYLKHFKKKSKKES